jgi:hypothetical protein
MARQAAGERAFKGVVETGVSTVFVISRAKLNTVDSRRVDAEESPTE